LLDLMLSRNVICEEIAKNPELIVPNIEVPAQE